MVTDRNLKPKEEKIGKTETAEECINKVKMKFPASEGKNTNGSLFTENKLPNTL